MKKIVAAFPDKDFAEEAPLLYIFMGILERSVWHFRESAYAQVMQDVGACAGSVMLQSKSKGAKVFALPSLNEGVGLVALEAAIHGCNIVITNLGGPKEYYNKEMVELVNPYDIDDIGKAIVRAMEDCGSQPSLRKELKKKYNVSSCVDQLIESYQKILS